MLQLSCGRPYSCRARRSSSLPINLDVYNLFNVNIVLGVNCAYATWERPTQILLARFAKIGVQFDF